MSAYIFVLALLALMWFLIIRPQRRRQQAAQQLLTKIGVGKEPETAVTSPYFLVTCSR